MLKKFHRPLALLNLKKSDIFSTPNFIFKRACFLSPIMSNMIKKLSYQPAYFLVFTKLQK